MRFIYVATLLLLGCISAASAFAHPASPGLSKHMRRLLGNIIATSAEPDCLLLQHLHASGSIDDHLYDHFLRTSGRGHATPARVTLSAAQQRRLRMYQQRRAMNRWKRFLFLR